MENKKQENSFITGQHILIDSSVDDGNMEFVMLKCSLNKIRVHHDYKPYNKMTPSIKYRQCESL